MPRTISDAGGADALPPAGKVHVFGRAVCDKLPITALYRNSVSKVVARPASWRTRRRRVDRDGRRHMQVTRGTHLTGFDWALFLAATLRAIDIAAGLHGTA